MLYGIQNFVQKKTIIVSSIKHILYVGKTFIMKIKSNTTNTATHWATRTTDFLPRHITTVARTGRRISIFFWRSPL